MDKDYMVELDPASLLARTQSEKFSYLSTSDGFEAAQDDYFSSLLDKEIEAGLLDEEIRNEEVVAEVLGEILDIVSFLEDSSKPTDEDPSECLSVLTQALNKDVKRALLICSGDTTEKKEQSSTIAEESSLPGRSKRPLPEWPQSMNGSEDELPTAKKAAKKFFSVVGDTETGRGASKAREPWYGCGDHTPLCSETKETNKRMRRERARNELVDMDEHYGGPSQFDDGEDLRAWLADRLYRQLCLNILRNVALGYHPGVWVREATGADYDRNKCVINLNGKGVVLVFDEEEIEKYLNGDEDTGFKNYGEFQKLARDWSHDEHLQHKQAVLYGGKARERRYFDNDGVYRRRPYGVKIEVYTYNSDPRLWHLFVMRLLSDVIEWTTAKPSSAEPPTVANTKEQIYRSAEEIGHMFMDRLHHHADEVLKAREILSNVRLWQRDVINVQPDSQRRRLIISDARERPRIEYPPRRTSLLDREVGRRMKRSVSVGTPGENDRLLFNDDRNKESWSVDDKALKLRERRRTLAETFSAVPCPATVGDVEEFELFQLGYARFNSRLQREESFKIKDKVYCQNSEIDPERAMYTESDVVLSDDGHYCVVKLCSGVTMQSLCVPMVHGAVAERLNSSSIKAVVMQSTECMCALNSLIGTRGARVRVTNKIKGRISSSGTVVQCYKHMVWVRLDGYSCEDLKAYVCLEEKSLEIVDGRFGMYCVESRGSTFRQNASRTELIQKDSFVRVDGRVAFCLHVGEDAALVLIEKCTEATPISLDRMYLAEGEHEVYGSTDHPTRAVTHLVMGRLGFFHAIARFGSVYFLKNVDQNNQIRHVSVDVLDASSVLTIGEEEGNGIPVSPRAEVASNKPLPNAMHDPTKTLVPALQREYDRLLEVEMDGEEFDQDLVTDRVRLSGEIDLLRQLVAQKETWLQKM